MFWTEEKLQARISELKPYRYRDAIKSEALMIREVDDHAIGQSPPQDAKWQAIRIGDRWKGRDRYAWLAWDAAIPESWSGRMIVGRFDFGRTGPGNNDGFESLLYMDGSPYQGVDINHQEVFLPGDAAGRSVPLRFLLWSGLEGGGAPQEQEHQIRAAEAAWLDEAADDLYYTAQAVLDTVRELSDHSPERQDLLKALERAFLFVDWSKPGSNRFYASVSEARDALRTALSGMDRSLPVTVQCIGHTHIDVAWLWRLRHTREKTARSFSTVLRLMENYPEYIFLQSQPQLYEYLKSDYPDIYEQIRDRVKEGRWEAGGAMWLEADCNLISGESLVRQILYGTRFFKKEFNVDCTYLWLPDVFGYSWALPQVLLKSGIQTMMTTKISWNQYNRMPHDTFQWRGIDGSEVLVHFITTPEQSDKWWYTYNGDVTPMTVKGIWDGYRDKEANRDLLLSYGYGDGGGGVNRDMLERRRRLADMPGLPKVTTGRVDEYFAKLRRNIANTDGYVHVWDGELYLEYHRGTYTSQAWIKRMNRKLELLARETEWLQAWDSVRNGQWPRYQSEQLEDSWKTILRNQFHDIIPGSSIAEVYEDALIEYKITSEQLNACRNRSLTSMTEMQRRKETEVFDFTVFNGTPWARSDVVDIPAAGLPPECDWLDAEGDILNAVKRGDRWQVSVQKLPPMGALSIQARRIDASAPASPTFRISERRVETPFYVLEWNDRGQLTSVYDKNACREALAAGEAGNVLQVFEDKPKMFDAWDIDIFYQQKMRVIDSLVSETWEETGPLRAVLRMQWEYGDSIIEQRMIVYSHSRRIDFETRADWRERQQLLKVAFPVAIRATEATYDIQFGNVKRPTHWNTSWDYARFETVGQQWADLSERGYGVSLLNDCKYGYDIRGNVMRLSLIKSSIYPDPTADLGEHRFTYSLLPHSGDWYEGGTVQEAWALNNPLTCVPGVSELSGKSLIRIDERHVIIDSVKKAEDEDAIIVRLHEYAGERGRIRIESDWPIASWQPCDLMERPCADGVEGANIELDIHPYEIVTLLIRF